MLEVWLKSLISAPLLDWSCLYNLLLTKLFYTSGLPNITPYELWMGLKPDLSDLCIFSFLKPGVYSKRLRTNEGRALEEPHNKSSVHTNATRKTPWTYTSTPKSGFFSCQVIVLPCLSPKKGVRNQVLPNLFRNLSDLVGMLSQSREVRNQASLHLWMLSLCLHPRWKAKETWYQNSYRKCLFIGCGSPLRIKSYSSSLPWVTTCSFFFILLTRIDGCKESAQWPLPRDMWRLHSVGNLFHVTKLTRRSFWDKKWRPTGRSFRDGGSTSYMILILTGSSQVELLSSHMITYCLVVPPEILHWISHMTRTLMVLMKSLIHLRLNI